MPLRPNALPDNSGRRDAPLHHGELMRRKRHACSTQRSRPFLRLRWMKICGQGPMLYPLSRGRPIPRIFIVGSLSAPPFFPLNRLSRKARTSSSDVPTTRTVYSHQRARHTAESTAGTRSLRSPDTPGFEGPQGGFQIDAHCTDRIVGYSFRVEGRLLNRAGVLLSSRERMRTRRDRSAE